MRLITVALSFLLLWSCRSNTQETSTSSTEIPIIENKPEEIIEQEEMLAPDPDIQREYILKQTTAYLESARIFRENMIATLENSTPEEVDSIYMAGEYRFIELRGDYPHCPEHLLEEWMHRCTHYLWDDGPELSDWDAQLLAQFQQEGMHPLYEGEGYWGMHAIPEFYFDLFAPYVTEETKDFMRIATDYDGQIVYDAGLILSMESLYERSIRWEKYLITYPDGTLYDKAVHEFATYMGMLMFCTFDNTPRFDYRDTNKIDEYYFKDIKELTGKNPETVTDSILTVYVEEVEKNNKLYSKELQNKILGLSFLKEVNWNDIFY